MQFGDIKRESAHATKPSSRTRRNALRLAKAAVAVGLLCWLVLSGRLDLWAIVSPAHRGAQLVGLAAVIASVLLQYVRWWIILREIGVAMSLRDAVEVSMVAQFLSTMLPGAAGSEIVRAFYVARSEGGGPMLGALSVVADRVLGLLTLLWCGVTGLLVLLASSETHRGMSLRILVAASAAAIVGSLGIAVLFHPSLRRPILGLLPASVGYRLDHAIGSLVSARGSFVCALGLSLAATVCVIVAFAAAGRSVDACADWVTVCAVVPVVLVASVLPVSPGGLGVAEVTAAFSFAQFGIEHGASMMAMYRIWCALVALPGALLYLTRSKERYRPVDTNAPADTTAPARVSTG